jgi:diadenosine tetraphosphate (Ap4A) HIT family hydrolase
MTKGYDVNNIFAKIIRGEILSNKVYEDDEILAFDDIVKLAPVHILVIPKGQFISFADFVLKAGDKKMIDFFKKVREIATSLGLDNCGYRLITNNGINASQTVLHFHIHILGGKKLKEL